MRSHPHKSRRPNECYLCGARPTTRDHVPPKGIYPDPKPANLTTVPACDACNTGTKLHDEYFRWFVTTASPGSEEANLLAKTKIIRGFRERPALLHHVMSRSGRLPVFTPQGFYIGIQPVFEFDRPRVQLVIDKIVKGLYFYHLNRRLSSDAKVDNFILNPVIEEKEFQDTICALPLFNIGDGAVFSYRFMEFELQPDLTFWFLMFFNRVLIVTKTESNKMLNTDVRQDASLIAKKAEND